VLVSQEDRKRLGFDCSAKEEEEGTSVSEYWKQIDALGEALNQVHEAGNSPGPELDAAATRLDAACRAVVGPVVLRYKHEPKGIAAQRVKLPVRDGEGTIEKVVEVFEVHLDAGSVVDVG